MKYLTFYLNSQMSTPLNSEIRKFPIGKFKLPERFSPESTLNNIRDIENLPHKLRNLVTDWNEKQMETSIPSCKRSARQTIHHMTDSHINGYLCHKQCLSVSDYVAIKPDSQTWNQLGDSNAPYIFSISLLECLHAKWVFLLHSLSDEEMSRTFFHPGEKRLYSLYESIAFYAWHGEHHLAQLQSLKASMNW